MKRRNIRTAVLSFAMAMFAVPAFATTSTVSKVAEANPLAAHTWLWRVRSSQGSSVNIERSRDYELTFAQDGSLSIKADCNRASGEYKIEEQNLSIKIGPSTMAACPGSSRGEEFLQLLGNANRFVLAAGTLIIILNDDIVLSFTAPAIVDHCGEKVLEPRSLSDTIDLKLSGELDQALAAFMAPGGMAAPGVSMLVITPKGKYFKSVGVSDATNCSPLTADSQYQIGSNTKMMTSAIVFQLQEAGKLSTSDKLSKYLPELAAKLPYGNEITIDMLLTHTSGLFDYFEIDNGDGGMAGGARSKAMLERGYSPTELVDLVAKLGKSEFKPGEIGKWKYCNTGYILLGMIIEKVTRRSYEANLKSRIFQPLKLKKTFLQTGQPAKGLLPHAYYQPPFTFTTSEWNASQGWAAGAVVSTSEEFAVFLKALFTGKFFKNRDTLNKMTASLPAQIDALGKGMTYGHGMMNNNGVLGHGGQTLGFQSDGGYIPEKDITFVIWSNSASNNVNRLVVPGLAKLLSGEK